MKKYKFEVIIHEGNDEWWESFDDRTGCDEVLSVMKEMLDSECYDYEIKLIEYTDGK